MLTEANEVYEQRPPRHLYRTTQDSDFLKDADKRVGILLREKTETGSVYFPLYDDLHRQVSPPDPDKSHAMIALFLGVPEKISLPPKVNIFNSDREKRRSIVRSYLRVSSFSKYGAQGSSERIEQYLKIFTRAHQKRLSTPFFISVRQRTADVFSSLCKGKEDRLRSGLLWKLKKWQQNPEDWGPETCWPTHQAFNEAKAFVASLPTSTLSSLSMDIAEDGEINFYWNTEDIVVDLGFYGTRPCSYFARNKRTGKKVRGSSFDPAKGLPDKLKPLFTL